MAVAKIQTWNLSILSAALYHVIINGKDAKQYLLLLSQYYQHYLMYTNKLIRTLKQLYKHFISIK